jgi:non-ribosomal peptide synthetase component E (peptide arylation enzyme)
MATHTDPDDRLAETEGRPMPGVQLRVVTLDGRDAEPGEEGELRAQAPQLMKGYVDENLEDAALDEHGFFRTGDLGRIDDLGYVTVTGRLKDVIIRKGENISAKEVEDLLFSHPDVADVAVIGLPDAEVGERCCAVLVAKDAANPPSFDALVAHLKAEGLMTQKLPERIEFLPSLPRNPAGKVLKHELRQRYS